MLATQEQTISDAVRLSMEAKELIAEEHLARISGFTETDMKYLREFWPILDQKEWFILKHEMILSRLTTATGKDAVRDFYRNKLLNGGHIEGTDYKKATREEIIAYRIREDFPVSSKFAKLPVLYWVTPECFASLLLSSGTQSGRDTRRYFIKVHNLSKLKTKVMVAYREHMIQQRAIEEKAQLQLESQQAIEDKNHAMAQVEELTREVREAKQNFANLVNTLTPKEKTNFAYIATCSSLAKQNKFKPGKATNLTTRLAVYNTGRPANDRMEYIWIKPCYETQAIENILKNLLDRHREGRSSADAKKCTEVYSIDPYVLISIMEDIVGSQNSAMAKYNTWIMNLKNGTHISQPIPSAVDHTRYRLDGTIAEIKVEATAREEVKAISPPATYITHYASIDNTTREAIKNDLRTLTKREVSDKYRIKYGTFCGWYSKRYFD